MRIANSDGLIQSITYHSKSEKRDLARFEHNREGQLVFCHSFQYGELHHRYNDAGYMHAWWDSDATSVNIDYDERGRVIGTRTKSGHYTERYEYDDENRCTRYFDAEGGESCYWYNDDDVVTQTRDALGNITRSEWEYGLKTAHIDALGRETRYRYNDYGDISQVETADGRVFQYKYNPDGLLLEVKNPLGECWEYRYGSRNELRFVIAPNKLKWEYRYNARYQVVRQQFPDDNYVSYRYNDDNQLIGIRHSQGEQTELMTEEGYIDYRQKLNLWGEAEIDGYRHHAANDSTQLKCNHRFVGQYYDEENGLHYNRFRYYSPETGQYISSDPIGLLGGFNPYGYVFDPTGWVDPLGLALEHVIFPPDQVLKEVTIQMQGSRSADFKAANTAAKINGVSGNPTTKAHRDNYGEVTWHHANYDPTTNTATMQLVEQSVHEASLPHACSVRDFEQTTGLKYETPEAKQKAAELNAAQERRKQQQNVCG